MAESLEEFLAERDVPCPNCEYNLRGLTGATCPECGEALELRVGMVEPKLGAFIAGLIGLACGAGFHAMVLLWAVLLTLRQQGGPERRDLLVLVAGLVICSAAIAAWLKSRRRVRQTPHRVRVALVVGCWLLSMTTAVVFFLVVGG